MALPRNVPPRSLTGRPDLAQLKRQAKELLSGFTDGVPDVVAEVQAHYHDADASSFALHDAQLVLARAYGFESWPRLKAFVDGATVHRLIEAVTNGDLDAARAMLAQRPELVHVDAAEHDEHRALHHAVLCRRPEMVQLLMDHGADARKGIYPHRDATSPFTLAAERGYTEIETIIREVEQRRGWLVTREPDVSAQLVAALEGADSEGADEDGVIAALDAHPEFSRIADPHDGVTALHIAAARLWERLVSWLLDHGAAANARTHRGHTPLDAIGRGSRRVSDADRPALAARIEETLIARGGERTIRSAIAAGDVAWLCERHDRGQLQKRGLLTHAVMVNRPEVVALLLDLGFDPDERHRLDGLEETVLSWGEPLRACATAVVGRVKMAEMLLARGADPNTNVYASSSALYEAYARRDTEMIALLERHGGVVTATMAGALGLTERAGQLLADDAADSSDTARELAEAAAADGHVEIVRLALAHIDWPRGDVRWRGPLMHTFGFHEHSENFVACFRLLLDRSGPHVHRAGARTLLHDVAAAWPRRPLSPADRVILATALLDAGARLDVRDGLLESTPLGWACRWGRTELVTLFLERGADPVEADAEPWATPRAWAEKSGHRELLSLLGVG